MRTYLLAYGAYFHSLSLDQLCQMFELPEKQARFMSSYIGFNSFLYGRILATPRGLLLHELLLWPPALKFMVVGTLSLWCMPRGSNACMAQSVPP